MGDVVDLHDKREWLETSLKIKRARQKSYLKAAAALEEKADQYKRIASELGRGCGRTQQAILRIQRLEKNEHRKRS